MGKVAKRENERDDHCRTYYSLPMALWTPFAYSHPARLELFFRLKVTSRFELYAVFGPLVSKSAVVLMSNKLLKWIRKHEDSLLILNSPSFEKYR